MTPLSNSEPWLPTRLTSSGRRLITARSRSARPEITAACVAGNSERPRKARIESRSGRARDGSSTIGAMVPS